jgi:arabinofuranosyltransferase
MSFPTLLLASAAIALSATALSSRFPRGAWAVAVAAAGGVLLLHVAYLDFFVSDDAFISLVYARNWADGRGPVWNVDDRVDGYTNFLWTGLLAVSAKAGLPLTGTAFWGGFAATLAVLVATVRLASYWPERRAGPEAGTMRFLLLAVLLLAANGTLATWAHGGLEGPLFTAFLVWAAYRHFLEEEEPQPLPLSAVLLLGAALTRPEGAFFFVGTAAFKVYGFLRGGPSRDRLVWLIAWAALFTVPFAVYFGWHWAYYDYPFPNSYYAKVGSGLDQYERGLEYVVRFGRQYGLLLAPLLPVVFFTRPDRVRQTSYLCLLLTAWTGYLVYIGGDNLPQSRLFFPALPFLYLLGVAGALDVLQTLRLRLQGGARRLAVGLALVLLLAVTLQPSTDALGDAARERKLMGTWLREHVPPHYVIATAAAGALPYYSRLRTIDVLGINDRHIAHEGTRVPGRAAGHDKYDSEYVLVRRPEIIIIVDYLDRSPRCRAVDYRTQELFQLIPALQDLAARSRTFDLYRPEAVQLNSRWFNLLVRNDLPFSWSSC